MAEKKTNRRKGETVLENSNYRKIDFIKKIPLFKDAEGSAILELEKISEIKKYPKNFEIIKEGASGDDLYVIMEGSVKICRTASGSKSKTLAIMEKNDFFGEMALIDKELRSASCIAMTECVLLVISRNNFEKMLKENSKLAFVIFKTFSARLREADKQIEILSFQNVLGRLAILLLDMAKRYGKKVPGGILITKDFTHQDLADMVGTAREMISRILNNFKENKCIKYQNDRLIITNRNKLLRWVY